MSTTPHIIIIGAGITGLILAQALKKENISFSIYERDPGPSHRGKGWGLTIHWALDNLLALLPDDVLKRLPETYVNPEAVANGEKGNFLFFDLRSGEARWKVPPAERIRVSRQKLRRLLMEGLDIQWNKKLITISESSPTTIQAHFSDSTSASGTFLVACDGSRSRVRSLLCPTAYKNAPLPIRFLGVATTYPTSIAASIRQLDPYFMQGGDPETDVFFWFSFLDTPTNNSREDSESYDCQIMVGWPFRTGFQGREEPLEVPETNQERLDLMKSLVEGWTEPFRSVVLDLPDETEVKSISLEDWIPKRHAWDNWDGHVTLLGDAAHAMTMFRGEAANHGIVDIEVLLRHILPVLKSHDGEMTTTNLKTACNLYEAEMIKRTAPAVLNSRQACLDAHNYAAINDKSPLVARRVAVEE